MTSVISSNLQWEVAGKRTLRKNTVANGNGFTDANGKKKTTANGKGVVDVSKFPRLEAAGMLNKKSFWKPVFVMVLMFG